MLDLISLARQLCGIRDEPPEPPITCGLCGATVPDVDTAIAEGWMPTYWLDDTHEVDMPVCPPCITSRMRSVEGDIILKTSEGAP